MAKMPRDLEERRIWIRCEMLRRRLTFAALGRELGISKDNARSVLFRSYPRVEAALAAKLGVPERQLWPERHANPRRLGIRVPKEVPHA